MKITVIIPTYMRAKHLRQALQSLQEQTLPEFEILVVDNAADSSIRQLVDDFNLEAKFPARYIPEPDLGLHNARHAGARRAKGEILVFTDDDATFVPDWLRAYAQAFDKHPEMAAAGGPVRPLWETPPPEWVFKFWGNGKVFGVLSLMEPFREFLLTPEGYFFGVNMAIRRGRLFEVGGFNPDSFGDIWLGDGESGLNSKLWDNSMLIGYIPEALVYHHIPPERMTVKYFCHRWGNQGVCVEYSNFHYNNHDALGLLFRLARIGLITLPKLGFILYKDLLTKNDSLSGIKFRMNLAFHFSRFRYILRLARDRKFRDLVIKKDWLT